MIIPAHDEEGVIGARLDNLLALDYPREQLEIVVARTARPTAPTQIVGELRGARPARPPARAAARRQARRAEPRRRREHARGRRVLRRELDVGSRTRCASSSATSPTTTSRTSAASSRLERPDGTNREGVYWRYELWLRESESRARLDHRRQRRDLRRAPRRLRRLTASARTSACPTRWSRAASAPSTSPRPSRREKPPGNARGRVPPQGAHVPVGVAAHVPGPDARRRRAALPLRARLAPRAPLRERAPARRAARDEHRARVARPRLRASCSRGSSRGWRSPRSAGCASASPAPASRTTTSSSRGRRSPRSSATCASASRRTGSAPRAHARRPLEFARMSAGPGASQRCSQSLRVSCGAGSGTRPQATATSRRTWGSGRGSTSTTTQRARATRGRGREDGEARRADALPRDVELPDAPGHRGSRARRALHRGRARGRDADRRVVPAVVPRSRARQAPLARGDEVHDSAGRAVRLVRARHRVERRQARGRAERAPR